MLASVTLALGLCVTACGPGLEVDTDDTSSTTADETGPSMTTMVSSTTVVPGTATDDGPAMTTIAETSSDGDSSDDAPCGFYAGCPTDLDPSPIECDTFAQDCPEGEKCMPWANDGSFSWNATRCSPVAEDPGQEGDPCQVEGSGVSGLDDCDVGLMCFEVDTKTNEGTCHALCGGTPDEPTCPSEDQFCSITGDGLLTLCLDSCDPLMSTCEPGESCQPHSNGLFTCVPVANEGTYGDGCTFINDCGPGHACLGATAVPNCMELGCCTPYCDTTAPDTCPDAMQGVACQPWHEPGAAPPGLEDVGACALPP